MLIIIDVQDYYLEDLSRRTGWNQILQNIKQRVRQAVQTQERILLLNHPHDGITLPEILEEIEDYSLKYFLYKEDFDGSAIIKNFCDEKSVIPTSLELCGLFEDVCLLETWKGIRNLGLSVRPINPKLTIKTDNNWRKIYEYPKRYKVRARNFGRKKKDRQGYGKYFKTSRTGSNNHYCWRLHPSR